MLVCRRWRQVCLDHAALWSFISVPPSKHQRLEDRLRLSAGFPLSLRFTLTKDENEISLQRHILRSHSGRVQDLELTKASVHSLETIMTDVDALPALRRIKLVHFRDTARRWGMSESLQSSVAPNLRSLTLRHSQCSGGWDLFSDLTLLWLEGYICSMSGSPTLDNVLAVIARSPRLVTLRWNVELPGNTYDIEPTTTTSFATIELPRLAHLNLRAKANCTRLILNTLRIPTTAAIALRFGQPCDRDGIMTILGFVRKHFRRAGGPLCTFIDVQHDDRHSYFRLRAYTRAFLRRYGDEVEEDKRIEPPALFDLLLVCGDQTETRAALLEVIHALPIDPSSVSVDAITDFTAETWRALASALPQLRSIRIDLSDELHGMLEGIMEPLDHRRRSVSGQLESRVQTYPTRLVVNVGNRRTRRRLDASSCLEALRRRFHRFWDEAGERWKVLEFVTGGERDAALALEPHRDEFLELVETLIIDGVPYAPRAAAERAIIG